MKVDTIPVTSFEQNCSLLWCEVTRKAAVVDPGGDLWLIRDLLEWEGLELEVILITHGHGDHAGGAAELAESSGALIAGPHRGDRHLVENLSAQADRYGIQARDFTPRRWLEDGDTVRFGQVELQVLHCPGHCRGHLAYFHPPSRQAFVGDILFRNAIGAWEHPDGSLPDLIASIRDKLFPLGDDVCFVPGHGPLSTFGHEREHNPFVGDAALAKWQERRRRTTDN